MLIIVVFITLLMGAPEGDICMGKTKPKAIRTSSLSVCNRNAGGGGGGYPSMCQRSHILDGAIMFYDFYFTFNESKVPIGGAF